MIRKNYNHTPQTNPWHRENEPHNNNSHKTPGRQKSKATSSLFPTKMIAKLEKPQHTAQLNMEQRTTAMGASINNESTTSEPPP